MSAQNMRSRGAVALDIGGSPRVDLLPPEVRSASAARVLRRRLGVAMIGVVAVVVLGIAASSIYALNSVGRLLAAQNSTGELLSEQAKYIEVRQVQQELAAVGDARQVGSWTEVQWREYLGAVQASLPAGVVVTNTIVTAASPFDEFQQAVSPLQVPRIATLALQAESATLPDVPRWLDGLATVPGFAGATPDTISLDATSGIYKVTLTMHVNGAALAGRFVPEAADPAVAEADESADADATAQGGN